MKKFFAPLITFIVLMGFLALLTLFLPSIHTQTQAAESQIGPSVEAHYWGLHWAMSSSRLIIFAVVFLLILFIVGAVWIKRKWGKNN